MNVYIVEPTIFSRKMEEMVVVLLLNGYHPTKVERITRPIAMVFKKRETPDTASQMMGRKGPPSIIGADVHVVGNIESAGELHIDGRVDGNIHCERLTVGELGQVNGKISVIAIRLLGSVVGPVLARSISVMKTARINGDVSHEKIEVEAGALIDGHYKRLTPEDFEKKAEGIKKTSSTKIVRPPVAELPKPAESLGEASNIKEPISKPISKKEAVNKEAIKPETSFAKPEVKPETSSTKPEVKNEGPAKVLNRR